MGALASSHQSEVCVSARARVCVYVHARVNITVWKQIHGELSVNDGKTLECLWLPR